MKSNPYDDDMATQSRCACMLANTNAIDQSFARISYQFDLMFAKKEFLHNYFAEGMEEMDFTEAR